MDDDVSSLIDINTADAKTLAQLPGIGEKLAERIIRYRQEAGPFTAPADLAAVRGISARMVQKWGDRLTASDAPADNNTAPPDLETPPAEPPVETKTAPESEEGYLLVWEDETDEPDAEESDVEEALAASHPIEKTEDMVSRGEETEPPADQPKVKEAPPVEAETPPAESEEGYVIEWGEELAESAAPTAEVKKVAASSFRRAWLLMLVGALLGAFLSLASLYVINEGTLIFSRHPTIMGMQGEVEALRTREKAMSEDIQALKAQVEALSGLESQVKSQQAEIQLLNQKQTKLEQKLSTIEEQAAALQAQVAALEETTSQMGGRLDALEQDAGRFNTFLEGLKALLSDIVEEESASQ